MTFMNPKPGSPGHNPRFPEGVPLRGDALAPVTGRAEAADWKLPKGPNGGPPVRIAYPDSGVWWSWSEKEREQWLRRRDADERRLNNGQ
jgi:hypothetical protein